MSDRRRPIHVAVVGAGVIGLTVATRLIELASSDRLVVTLVAEKFPPNTTSDLSGGFAIPPHLAEGPDAASRATTERRVRATFKKLDSLYHSPKCSEVGVTIFNGYYQLQGDSLPWWRDIVFGFRHASEAELAMLSRQGKPIYVFSCYLLQCKTYVPWLLQQFKMGGGVTLQASVNNLSELNNFDVVVNCTGLAAAQLAQDPRVYPAAGLMVAVRAPWISHFYLEPPVIGNKERTYIFPLVDYVILGSTFEAGKSTAEINPDDVDGILKRCQEIAPSLSEAEVVDTWVGIRPMRRGGMRLEREEGTKKPAIIHCYGHGHQAMALSWGSAEEIADMVMAAYTENMSKL